MINNKINAILVLIIVLVITVCGIFYYHQSTQAQNSSKNKIISLDNVVLEDMQGHKVPLTQFKGKKIYIKLWASWCPICLDGLRHVDELSAKQDKDFEVITVVFPNQFNEKNQEAFRAWFTKLPYKHTTVLFDVHGVLPKLLNLQGFPTSLFVNKELQVQALIPGNIANDTITSDFQKLGDKAHPINLKTAATDEENDRYNNTSAAKEPDTSKVKIFIDPKKYHRQSTEELKKRLTRAQFEVTQYGATEQPFANKYFDTMDKGIYVDITTGEPLFSSTDKYHSGCGWPSFVKPISPEVVTYNKDTRYGMERTEVRSRIGNCHLGHVFDDGPTERGGKRYCINSAALRFIPLEDMEREGYGYLIPLIH